MSLNLKRMTNTVKILCILIIAISNVYGCKSSSYTQRYKSASKDKKKTESVRYPVEEKKDTLQNYPDDFYEDDEDIEDYSAEEDSIIIQNLLSRYAEFDAAELDPNNISIKDKVIMEIIKYLNTPYRYGGNSWKGIDCSAFTKTIINNIFAYELPRSAREQYTVGDEIDRTNLKFGDLVFFNTRRRVRPGHVGIYIGDNLFAHASRKLGVTVSSLESKYYNRTYMGARRLNELEF